MTIRMNNKLVSVMMIFGVAVLAHAEKDPRLLKPLPEVTSQEVAHAVEYGVNALRRGLLNAKRNHSRNTDGAIALAVLALRQAGVPADDPAVLAGVEHLDNAENIWTYVVSMKCQMYASVDPIKHRDKIAEATEWLVRAQLPNGMWTYTSTGGAANVKGDNSNTQFAVLGLNEAANIGIDIPRTTWQRVRKHFELDQHRDGGWAYRRLKTAKQERSAKKHERWSSPSPAYGSMTTAGLGCLYIAEKHLGVEKKDTAGLFKNGKYIHCGRFSRSAAIGNGLRWMNRHFIPDGNPRIRGKHRWMFYYHYGVERVGTLSGLRDFGNHNWFREGASFLLSDLNSWGSGNYNTAFVVMFPSKGNRPILFQKLKWQGRWNRNINDLKNLTEFIGDKLGKEGIWQTTSLLEPLSQWRQGPVLMVTGHKFPRFKEVHIQKFRQYVQSGGTLLFEACCGSEAFNNGFVEFAKRAWPENELKDLPASHSVFSSHFKIDQTYSLQGLDMGCRTSVFYSPKALSSLWQLRTVPQHSKLAFELGTNILAYATGKEAMPNKLDKVELSTVVAPASEPAAMPRGTVQIARLIHGGDYNADSNAMLNLAADLRDKAKVNIVARKSHIQPTDEAIYKYPLLFMTGHGRFQYSQRQITALREYLNRGGFLISDACCGSKEFDAGFREMVEQLYPNDSLQPASPEHPILKGKVGVSLGELSYRKVLAEKLNTRGTTSPSLETVAIDGRTVIIYSRYDWSCALQGDKPSNCHGYADNDGQKLARSIGLFAIGY